MERRHRTVLVVVLLTFATALAVVTIWLAYQRHAQHARSIVRPEHATGSATDPR